MIPLIQFGSLLCS